MFQDLKLLMNVCVELNKMNIQRTDPKKLYKAICSQSRVLPVIDRLELIVSSIYKEAFEKNVSTKGRFEDAVKVIDPRKE